MNERHGQRDTPLYGIWKNMKTRCYNPNTKDWSNYGARGIEVCDAWRFSFTTFKKWADQNGYKLGLSLDRINVHKNYEPVNCRWVSLKEQSRNRIDSRYYTAFGETKLLVDWTEDSRCKVGFATLYYRYRHGWPAEKAITTKSRIHS